MLKNWTNLFIYHIKNNKLFTFLNVLGLSIGIAGLLFSILYWNDEQSYDAWNPEKETVFQVLADLGNGNIWSNNPVTLQPYIKDDPAIEKMMFCQNWYNSEIITYNGKKQILQKVFNTENDFFEFFPFTFIKGSKNTVFKNENSIAMTQKTASLFFGKQDAIGKEVLINNKIFTVTGVYKIVGNSSISPEAIINDMKGRIDQNKDQWGNFNFSWFIKLKDPTKTDLISKKLQKIYFDNKTVKEAKEEGISTQEFEKLYGKFNFILEPLTDSRLHTQSSGLPEGKGNYQFLLIMVGLSVLILILSIVNYVNLSTANAINRAKEVGVRKILGASKNNIVLQFLFETIITVLFSILLSLVIVELSLPYYNEFLAKNLIIFGEQFYFQLIIVFIITIVFSGIFPALYVSNFEILKVLKGNFGRSKSGIWVRNGMLIIQFAIASFFIVGSYIVYEQVRYLANKDLGFSGSQVLDLNYYLPESVYEDKDAEQIIFDKYSVLKTEISKIKGVEQVSTGAFRFGGGNDSSSSFNYLGTNVQGQNIGIDFGMLDMMKIKIVAGRNLSEKFASDTINSMLINETVLKMINEKNPIGKIVDWNDKKLKIVGIVKDFSLFNPQGKVPPMVFFHVKTVPWMIRNLSNIYVKVNTDNTEQTIAEIEKFWNKNVQTDYPFSYDFVDKQYKRTYQTYVKQKNLFSLLNFIVILIALFGLFALASFSIQRRMKEIAIRKTLGAETNVLLVSLSKQYVVFCLIGFLIALFPVYYLLNMWLENFSYRIEISWLPFVIGFFVLLLLTLIVVLSRAYQATKVDVLKYLKYE